MAWFSAESRLEDRLIEMLSAFHLNSQAKESPGSPDRRMERRPAEAGCFSARPGASANARPA